ncbi:MAG: glycosyltransferase family 2 protein [Acidimicrobiales bacterium]
MIVDAIVPARNEAPTVVAVVEACRGCRCVREVIVVDDGSTDATGVLALGAGAKVVRREGGGSKGAALEAGVGASDADAFLFVDADCIGLGPHHLDAICRPVVEGRSAMSLGLFDYGWSNWAVLRFPPTTGERIVPRWVFDGVPPAKRAGYRIEIFLNEVIAEGRLPATARIMAGVTHRTKREKLGRREGYRATWRMFREVWPLWWFCRTRTYWFYLRNLTIEA